MPVVQHLKKDIEHIGMSLFYLVEQNNGIRVAPDFLAQLPSVIMPYIARRGADHFGNAMFLHIF